MNKLNDVLNITANLLIAYRVLDNLNIIFT